MKGENNKLMRGWMAGFLVAMVLYGAWVVAAEPTLSSGSLGAVEYRALLAQSLIQQVSDLEAKTETLRRELLDVEARLRESQDHLVKSRKEVDTLRKHLAEREEEVEKRDQLLAVFRRGSFEYYEVRTGDTPESIAANPMIYGDAARAVWLRQANSLLDGETLMPGSVLVVPRFPEGFSHDL